MAESWIRMRGSLPTNPRVIAMARALLTDPDFLDWYGHTDVTPESSRVVTLRHVTVVTRVTVGALVPLWAMVNECAAEDGILHKTTLFEVDAMAGVPGFGQAMQTVGWLFETEDGICFPNFHEHNTVKESRSTGAKTQAERAKEYRDRQKTEGSAPSRNSSRDGVTEKRDASRDTVTTEKRREEKKENIDTSNSLFAGQPAETKAAAKPRLPTCPKQAIVDLYHEVLPELPGVRVMDAAREKAITTFWQWVLTTTKPDGSQRATTAEEALTWARDYFQRARSNDFIMGRGSRSAEHANWRCSIEYLLSSRGMKKVIEETQEVAP